jgi:hypothetical protein
MLEPFMPRTLGLLPLLLALATSPSLARERPFVDEPSMERPDIEEGAPWAEAGVTLPAYPQDADLVEFPVDNSDSPFRYFIDTKSLTVGSADQVVHFTLVTQSPSGARNISFEGLRCDTRAYKTYAFGTGKGRFRPLKTPRWKRIKPSSPYRHYQDLREFYFCQPDRYRPYPVAEIVRRFGIIQRQSPNTELF